jgi:predicted transcriptional regulator
MKKPPKTVVTFRIDKKLDDKVDRIVDASTCLNKSNIFEAAVLHFVSLSPEELQKCLEIYAFNPNIFNNKG